MFNLSVSFGKDSMPLVAVDQHHPLLNFNWDDILEGLKDETLACDRLYTSEISYSILSLKELNDLFPGQKSHMYYGLNKMFLNPIQVLVIRKYQKLYLFRE